MMQRRARIKGSTMAGVGRCKGKQGVRVRHREIVRYREGASQGRGGDLSSANSRAESLIENPEAWLFGETHVFFLLSPNWLHGAAMCGKNTWMGNKCIHHRLKLRGYRQ